MKQLVVHCGDFRLHTCVYRCRFCPYLLEDKCHNDFGRCGEEAVLPGPIKNNTKPINANNTLNCTPCDDLVRINFGIKKEFINLKAKTKLADYTKEIGVRYTDGTELNQTEYKKDKIYRQLRQEFRSMGKSNDTKLDWRDLVDIQWDLYNTKGASVPVEGYRALLYYQVVGRCGDYLVYLNKFYTEFWDLTGEKISGTGPFNVSGFEAPKDNECLNDLPLFKDDDE